MALSFRRRPKGGERQIDRLTGVLDRRQFDRDLATGIDPTEGPTASLWIDVDHFANHVRRHGAGTTDAVLERISWVVMATVRSTDIVYRARHSTFCVLLPATTDDAAWKVASRIRRNVERIPELADAEVTVSIGLAVGASHDLATTVERADRALVAGTAHGRNQVFRDGASERSRRRARRGRPGAHAVEHAPVT
ncbi:GGDEF domain-containing protein [Ilumatobacter sp.]|uniref:GGDEF domain-containing protein n=1 Tax=Ilumatobacter sp. TaxID=1967498 RepID=UPI003B52CD44